MSGQHARKVVITGIGLLTALGEGVQDTWDGILAGRGGVAPLRGYDPSSLRTQLGAQLVDFDPRRYVSRRTLRKMTPNDEIAMVGAVLALRDAGLEDQRPFGERAGLFVGGNKELSRPEGVVAGALAARADDGRADYHRLGRVASSTLTPLFYVEGLQAASLFYISEAYGFLGPNAYFAGTAEAGASAVGRAARAVRRGEADLALAGGFDDPTSWWSMSKMDGLGVLSSRNELGAAACRPYDRTRSGSVFGDGAAFLVLEEREAALARGARCYAEIRGVGAGNDGGMVVTPDPNGRGLVRAITAALRDADMPAEDVSYIASHGCATTLGDLSETQAIRRSLAAHADSVWASSVKPQTGHLVAGAGALNAAIAALALDAGVAPATANLDDPDPGCDLDWIPGQPREARLTGALALARGLAGQQVALALGRAA
ncbi:MULTISPECIES: beta-ketoacyl synthase [Protofrankia]|uniref:3-oxoacyl-ACP synthase n=1 Tax=Protofrankia coriariae TaxID=1562887 RepID=A0ABR5F6M6_9ACTN|nr:MULTISPECIES: beta-ketoacyl-[acyl-carrier-protein] synthase family protein [Protofrankia]KLL12383.1 3-oxoacyl-ACP synthase [Protofrankia coriariae]ONH37295.1 3-oxoacyl-ACP synthase [Protofrankia sp. BMG5.30]